MKYLLRIANCFGCIVLLHGWASRPKTLCGKSGLVFEVSPTTSLWLCAEGMPQLPPHKELRPNTGHPNVRGHRFQSLFSAHCHHGRESTGPT